MLHRVIRCYTHIHNTKGSTRESQGDTKCYIVLSGVTLTFTVVKVVHGSHKVIPSVTSCYQVLRSHSQ